MAAIQGFNGLITVNGFNMKFQSWTGTMNIDRFNTSGFEDMGWRSGVAANASMTFSGVAILDDSGTVIPATNATFPHASYLAAVLLTMDTGKTFGFNATISAIAIDRAEEGSLTAVRIDGESTGAVALTWG